MLLEGERLTDAGGWWGRLIWLLPLVAAALLAAGCGGGGEEEGAAALTIDQLVERGWQRFEDARYLDALGDFEAALGRDNALSDAWNGAGWSAGRLPGRLDQALDNFARCYAIDTTKYDALGGWSFALYQKDDWQGTLNKADSLLLRRPGWRFLHQPEVDFHDLWLLKARCYFNLGVWEASYQVVLFLNPSFEADISTALGRAELLEEIERLGQVYG